MLWAGRPRFPMTPSRCRSQANAREYSYSLRNCCLLTHSRGLPSPAGLQAHVELCRISDYIVYSSYRGGRRPGPPSKAAVTVHVDNALEMLAKWHASLPASLCLPDPLTLFSADLFSQASAYGQDQPDLLNGATGFGRDRACWALHMSYNQVIAARN